MTPCHAVEERVYGLREHAGVLLNCLKTPLTTLKWDLAQKRLTENEKRIGEMRWEERYELKRDCNLTFTENPVKYR